MKNPELNTSVLILIIITLVLLSSITLINGFETEEKADVLNAVTGEMQSFEVYHEISNIHYPTKKNTKRYDDKLFEYLGHIQEQRDKTFQRGRVFLREK
ncbi:MAG: hypothetical protein QF798_02425 [Candidatus Woesearchaeota archaeon]|nr:hypothetical protein [Candidatus Woesearchaeota archaeon]MDP6600269.1 hypothetical protein [Candidatus Woesearchaeota archaeon]